MSGMTDWIMPAGAGAGLLRPVKMYEVCLERRRYNCTDPSLRQKKEASAATDGKPVLGEVGTWDSCGRCSWFRSRASNLAWAFEPFSK